MSRGSACRRRDKNGPESNSSAAPAAPAPRAGLSPRDATSLLSHISCYALRWRKRLSLVRGKSLCKVACPHSSWHVAGGGEGLGRETNRFDADQGLVRRLIKTADPAPPPLQEAHDRRAPKSLLTCGKVCAQYAKLVQSPLRKTDPSASRTPDDPRTPGYGQSCSRDMRQDRRCEDLYPKRKHASVLAAPAYYCPKGRVIQGSERWLSTSARDIMYS